VIVRNILAYIKLNETQVAVLTVSLRGSLNEEKCPPGISFQLNGSYCQIEGISVAYGKSPEEKEVKV
jgi:hypothetical protein